jgi:hypothetical protein
MYLHLDLRLLRLRRLLYFQYRQHLPHSLAREIQKVCYQLLQDFYLLQNQILQEDQVVLR